MSHAFLHWSECSEVSKPETPCLSRHAFYLIPVSRCFEFPSRKSAISLLSWCELENTEKGGIGFIRNVGNYQPDYMCVTCLKLSPWKRNLAKCIIQSGTFPAWPRSGPCTLGRRFSVNHEKFHPVAGNGPPCSRYGPLCSRECSTLY
jgi:hypothetical protein